MTQISLLPGASITQDPDAADVNIVLFDHYAEAFARQVIELSQKGGHIWGFVPRSTKVVRILSDEINQRQPVQSIFAYDEVANIVSMAERTLLVGDRIPLITEQPATPAAA
ncbi:MAG: hypothetical protein AAB365_03010 [Patescibacteria group bacterium]